MGRIIEKQSKVYYYIKGYWRTFFEAHDRLADEIAKLTQACSTVELAAIEARVPYYCASLVGRPFSGKHTVTDLRHPQTPKAYYFDTYEWARYLASDAPIDFVFGDVTHVPDVPSLVKTRPLTNGNENSVLLAMDKPRHYVWMHDPIPFAAKRDQLIGMANVWQAHRRDFFEKWFGHPLCVLGDISKNHIEKHPEWHCEKQSLQSHLHYKFILSLQGNDVATNLKWIMSSNSVAVMPRPTVESWFMEGTLQGGEHYIEIRPDYSDLEGQLHYYLAHPEECERIAANANAYCMRFRNPRVEALCNLRVLERFYAR